MRGCPVYVLDPSLQDGKTLPKWHPRSRRGQYLGVSPNHSSTVGLILNLTTGFVSPQFHVVYDDLFSSVPNAETGGALQPDVFTGPIWDSLLSTGLERLDDGDYDGEPEPPPLHHDWLTNDELDALQRQRNEAERINGLPIPQPILPPPPLAPEGAVVPLAPEGDAPDVEDAPGPDPIFALDDDSVPPPEPLFPHQFPLDGVAPNAPQALDNEMPQWQMDGVWDDGGQNTTMASEDEVVVFDDEENERQQEKERRGQHFEPPDEMTFGRGKRVRKPNPKYASFSQARWAALSHFSHESETYARTKVKRDSLNDAFLYNGGRI